MNNPLVRWPAHAAALLVLLGMLATQALAAEAAPAAASSGVSLASGPIDHIDLARPELVLGGQRYTWDPARLRMTEAGADVDISSLRSGQWVSVQWEPGPGGYRRIRAIRMATVR
ncbi:hypothetical protein [Sphaerotilus microaerophilus]|uniref:Uncharacterized protein n=1 Tax=Sphaerotilus microaerophilus TaxID=2914710 RepID=A0ABM7YJV6_9BURK|nr:hypothetical protein [Sphaerotilus sp. FB-5]BDI04535.1 hypothetical protein CATMQ487_15050 [Sphaerotilus sp. FB-5]